MNTLQQHTFFPVSRRKLWVLSIASLGIYELYWFYKNWQWVRTYQSPEILIVWRTLFSFILAYDLFKRVKYVAEENGIAVSFNPVRSAVIYLVLSIAGSLPEPYFLVGLFTFVPLMAVQDAVNALNAKLHPFADKNERFGRLNELTVIIAVVLAVLLVLSFIG